MKKRISFILFVAFASFFTGCGDEDKKDDPTPETGTVTGTISPANSASKVYLIAGTDTIKGTPAASGTFELTDVKAGTYSLAFKATDAYDAPAPTNVTVTARQTTNVPAVTFTALPANGSMSVVINGVLQTGTVSYIFGNSYPISFFSNGFPNNYALGHEIRLTLPIINRVGTYPSSVRGPSHDELEFVVGYKNDFWVANYSNGSGSVTVTSYNPTTKRVSGTFNFTAVNSGFADKVGTSGVFKNIKYFY